MFKITVKDKICGCTFSYIVRIKSNNILTSLHNSYKFLNENVFIQLLSYASAPTYTHPNTTIIV